jgi:hypothetical protein
MGFKPKIQVQIANIGRRPVIVRGWGGPLRNGRPFMMDLGTKGLPDGIRLAESERYELVVERSDLTPFSGVEFVGLWVEDSTGRRYRAKDGRANVQRLRQSDSAAS